MNKQKLVSAWSDPELFYHKAKSYRLGNYEGDVLIPRVYRKLWRAEKDFDIHMQLNEEEGRDLPIQIWAVVEGLEVTLGGKQ